MNELFNELRKRKRSFVIQAISAVNHSQTLLNDLEVNGDCEEDSLRTKFMQESPHGTFTHFW